MNRERAKRREEIAVRMMATLNGPMGPGESYSDYDAMARDAIAMANALMAELDEAALADTPDADPLRHLAELQSLQEAKDAAVERSVKKSILIYQRDRQIAAGCEKLDALTQFAEAVRAEANDDPELYGPFVALVRDLDAKVGAK